jgi:glycosyltransferase involved in cell wall biosynthesis
MQAGIPVITTAAGLEGLDAQPGRDVLVAETPASFAEAVRNIQRDASLRERLVASSRAFVRANHSQEAITAAVATTMRGKN